MRKHGHGEPAQDPKYADVDYLKTLGYERRDIAIPTLTKWLGGLFVFIGGTLVLALGVYFFFVPRGAEEKASRPMNAVTRDVPADLAKVQAHPRRDMVLFRRREEQKVGGYGWVNRDKGIAHIPVERAIDEMAERGLSASPTPGR